MKNFVQSGDVISVIAPYQLTSGQGAKVGALFGIAATDAAAGAPVELAPKGVYDISAVSNEAGNQGAKIYWDAIARKVTTIEPDNTLVGCLAAGKKVGDLTARVLLNCDIR